MAKENTETQKEDMIIEPIPTRLTVLCALVLFALTALTILLFNRLPSPDNNSDNFMYYLLHVINLL